MVLQPSTNTAEPSDHEALGFEKAPSFSASSLQSIDNFKKTSVLHTAGSPPPFNLWQKKTFQKRAGESVMGEQRQGGNHVDRGTGICNLSPVSPGRSAVTRALKMCALGPSKCAWRNVWTEESGR